MNRRRKVTKELLNRLKEARKTGMTYKQIREKFAVSNWVCITYLKDVKIKEDVVPEEWIEVENKAKEVLEKKGFTNLLNLNLVGANPYWDYYAERDGKRWLIDVTINSRKSIVGKTSRMIDGFESAILYKNNGWKLIKIGVTEIN